MFTAFTYTLMGLVNGETSSVLSGTVTYAGAATTAITASPTPYTITPVVSGLSSANYAFVTVAGQLTIAPAPQVIAWTTPTAITYGTALSSTQLKAAVTGVPGGTAPGALVYTPAAGIVLGAGSQTLSVSAAATVNYAAATATVILLVNKAPQVITWNAPRAITYGTALSTTQLNAKVVGVTGGTAPGPSTYSPAAGAVLGAGTQLLSVSAAATANYAAATKSVALIVNKAIPTARATGGTFVYTGSPQPGTGTATGVAGAGLSPVRLSYTGTVSPTTAPTMVGSYSVTASFAGDANYLAATSTAVALRITKATATLVLSNLIQTYDGTPKAATVTTSPTGVSGVSVTYALLTNGRAGRASTTPPTALGSYVVTATLSNTNFQASTTTGTLVIRTAAVAKVTVLASSPENPAPSTGSLLEIYPNPLTERGTVHFHTAQGGKAQVYLYDEVGRMVATLYNADVQSGQDYYLPLQRGDLAEGVYVCRLIANGTVHNLRLNIVR